MIFSIDDCHAFKRMNVSFNHLPKHSGMYCSSVSVSSDGKICRAAGYRIFYGEHGNLPFPWSITGGRESVIEYMLNLGFKGLDIEVLEYKLGLVDLI